MDKQMSDAEIAEMCSEEYRPCRKEDVPAGSAFVDCSIGGDHRHRSGRTPDRRYMEFVDYAGGGRVGYARLREFVPRSPLETQVDAAITASIHTGGRAKLPWSEDVERDIRGRLDGKRVLDDPEADPEAAIGKVVLGANWSIHLLYPETERRSVAARELGRRGGIAGGAKGGAAKTKAKQAASRANGAKGGRPRSDEE